MAAKKAGKATRSTKATKKPTRVEAVIEAVRSGRAKLVTRTKMMA